MWVQILTPLLAGSMPIFLAMTLYNIYVSTLYTLYVHELYTYTLYTCVCLINELLCVASGKEVH